MFIYFVQSALGLELWSMSDDILFDNFIFTDDKAVADNWAEQTFTIKHLQELIGASSGVSFVYYCLQCCLCTRSHDWRASR